MMSSRSSVQRTFLAAMLACSTFACWQPLVHAQVITRAWTAPFPKGASSITYSHDALLYAYLLNDSVIVRGDAATGSPLDTVSVPVCKGIGYHGRRLYMMQTIKDGVRVCYLHELNDALICTGAEFVKTRNSQGFNEFANFKLLCIPGEERIAITAGEYSTDGSVTSGGGVSRVIDTVTHTMVEGFFGARDGVSLAADSKSFIASSSGSWGRNPYSSSYSTCRDYDVPLGTSQEFAIERSNSTNSGEERNDSLPDSVSLSGPIATGIRGLVLFGNVLYDMRYHRVLEMADSLPTFLCNLGANGLMLGMKPAESGRVVGSYDLASRSWISLDTIPPGNTKLLAPTVYSWLNVAFVVDTQAAIVIKYTIPGQSRNDTAVMWRSDDTTIVYKTVEMTVDLYSNRTMSEFKWFVNDTLVATTSQPRYTFRTLAVGEYRTHVVFSDSGNTTTTITSDKPLVVRRPLKCDMGFLTGPRTVRSIEVSHESRHLALGLEDTMAVYRLPPTPQDNAAQREMSVPTQGTLGFYGPNDSLLWLKKNGDGYNGTSHYWSLGAFGTDTSTRVRIAQIGGMMDYNGNGPPDYYRMVSYGRHMYNESTQRWFTLTRTRAEWFLGIHRDYIAYVPQVLDTNLSNSKDHSYDPFGLWRHGRQSSVSNQTISDADAGFESSLVYCTNDTVYLVDLVNNVVVDSFTVGGDLNITSAIQVASTLVVSTAGVFHKDSAWSLTQSLPFNDGIRIHRLPNKNFAFVLRGNSMDVGTIISIATGQSVYTLGIGFGTPTCAVYDSLRQAIHIGDNWGVVSTWSLPDEFTTAVSSGEGAERGSVAGLPDLRIIPNPTTDEFTIDGMQTKNLDGDGWSSVLQPLEHEPIVTIVSMTGIESTLRSMGERRYSVSDYHPGLYIVVARIGNDVRTGVLIKR